MEVRAKDLDSEVINVGQDENLGCKSIGGAVGGYVFVCVGSGASTTLLYSRKSQFPAILRRFILGVLALQWRIRIIRASDSEIVDNGEVEQICADHEILIQPTSQGSPEEMGRAENMTFTLLQQLDSKKITIIIVGRSSKTWLVLLNSKLNTTPRKIIRNHYETRLISQQEGVRST